MEPWLPWRQNWYLNNKVFKIKNESVSFRSSHIQTQASPVSPHPPQLEKMSGMASSGAKEFSLALKESKGGWSAGRSLERDFYVSALWGGAWGCLGFGVGGGTALLEKAVNVLFRS